MRAAAATIEMGSMEHREVLARFFLETHVQYVPEAIHWPALTGDALLRLTRLPFWNEAVATEHVTSRTVAAAAALERDPLIRRAIEMQGLEEHRHARLLAALTGHYRIHVDQPPPFQPRSLEHDFLFAGFGECFDSFFAFGLFELARKSGFFAPELLAIFEPIVQEEARHILFFVNWVKYRRSQLPLWRRPLYRLRCGWIILKQVASRIKTARTMSNGSSDSAENFTLSAHQDIGADVTLHHLLGICLAENERRMADYDSRLARPRLVPSLARLMYRALPASI
ncbi:MAG TPA: ferritin-like domain-containing protein [Steroidobacteraceae bacterium]|nr:ferritin-like domain-containing protein [Steroidobacteraceae bacterium]